MRTFYVKFTIRNPQQRERFVVREGLVDTGAHFTQVSRATLEQIGVTACGTRRVQYADGDIVSKPVASAEVLIDQDVTPTVILCGGPSDLILIGALTLEGLNLGVDPVRKVLVPLIAPQA
jgi:clan AA aspartic protease